MRLYRMFIVFMVSMVFLVGCKKPDEPDTSLETERPILEEIPIIETGDAIDSDLVEIDREGITARVYTIPKEDPYSTGNEVISSEKNALTNADFALGQAPWQINTVDGIVFDGGLIIENQRAELQHVILVQAVTGFEKMKSYSIKVEVTSNSRIPISFKVRDLEDNSVYAMVEIMTDVELETYEVRFPMNYELPDGAVLEVGIETKASDRVHVRQISLTRFLGDLVWSDEFDHNGLADAGKWGYDVGGTGWGNEEKQYYTDADSDNAFIEDGSLHIRAVEEEFLTNSFTSARLITRENHAFKFKRIEINAKLPDGIGTWPALWMLPADSVYGPWPDSGEIDILEHVGFDPDIVHGTVHTEKYNHMYNDQKSGVLYVPDSRAAFHRYTIDWSPYEIDFYVDDYLYFTYDNDGTGSDSWPFDQNFYLILSMAVGGSWGGQQGVDRIAFPAEMLVDYVRVYDLPIESQDIQAPEPVKDIDVEVTGMSAAIHWQQSKDDYLVDHYEVYLDEIFIGASVERDYTIDQLDSAGSYSVGVIAVDGAGNRSELITTGFVTEPVQQLP